MMELDRCGKIVWAVLISFRINYQLVFSWLFYFNINIIMKVPIFSVIVFHFLFHLQNPINPIKHALG